MISMMKRIFTAAGKYQGRIRLALVFSFLKAMLAKAPIGLAFFIIVHFYEGTMTEALCLLTGVLMLLSLVLQALFHNLSDRLQSTAGFLMFADKRMELGAHLRKMPMGYFTEGNIGKISSVLSTDMVFIEENCMTALADMMSYVFAQIIMTAFLFFLNPWLGLTALLVLLLVILTARGMERESLDDSRIRQTQSESLTKAVLDFAEGIGIIKSYNMLGEKSVELSENFQKSCETSIDFENHHAPWQRKLNTLYGMGAAVVLALAFWLQRRGALPTPDLIGLMLFIFDLFGPVRALYMQSTRLTVMSSCMDRVEEMFAQKELADVGTKRIPERGGTGEGGRSTEHNSSSTERGILAERRELPELAFQDVSFAYGKKEVLHHVSFSLAPNQMLALVGPSGGGKSTIASLLARFWDVPSGQVLIRGVNVRDVPLSDLMNHISMVFQRVYLFQDTIYNNISMGRPDADRQEVIEAAKKARCHDFIMALPDGYDTVIGEGGATLSGGEKQRISIARCILKDAPIVILDEATASVDADNESFIQQAITELCRGKTLLVIAHRLNTIQNADQILVVSQGQITQQGTHAQLMAEDGIYRRFIQIRENVSGWNQTPADPLRSVFLS
ncbi:MAG: ABC transporter ATP-binding protein [Eubacteriales bacterium]|nr:ABC transporter ATP-binding protein [Eubacteriales bacterium]